MSLPGQWVTYEDYKRLDDEKRYEVINGELLLLPTPSARHQLILGDLLLKLHAFVKAHALGAVLMAPLDVVLSEYDVVQPDILFAAGNRRPRAAWSPGVSSVKTPPSVRRCCRG